MLERFRGEIQYLSRIIFAIFFFRATKNVLMYCIWGNMAFFLPLPHFVRLIIYEIIPIGGSILIIALLSRLKIIKKYVFMIK